ncbi:MAG TPA: argininosuccinate synthase [Actinobacteria bacterium]|nr:argininosuccinate synthase [Actinomycetota bacterium]
MAENKKVVLAYSGGLDTSVAIKWLNEKGYEVIALMVDVGQGGDIKEAGEKALSTGATEAFIVEAKEEFITDFVWPALKANAMYQDQYSLATALSRPLIGKALAQKAIASGAGYVAHGSTGKGNDQVRIEVAAAAFGPQLKMLAPVRDWDMSRSEELEYAKKHGIKVEATKKSPYSIDQNLWGRSVECGVLEDPWVEPPADAYAWTKSPEDAKEKHDYINIVFQNGVPIAIDEKKMSAVDIVAELNKKAGEHGVGRVDMVEDRLVGIKSREIYEQPAAEVLLCAHKALEDLVLEKDVHQFKKKIDIEYTQLVYDGKWYSPLKESLDAFINKTQACVSGTVRVKLYKGNAIVVGRYSPYSLYDEALATYESGSSFDEKAAQGFIEVFGLGLKTWSKKKNKHVCNKHGDGCNCPMKEGK